MSDRQEFEHFILYEVINRCGIKEFHSNPTQIITNYKVSHIVATKLCPMGDP